MRRHQARVYRMLTGITGQAEDAQDCTQMVFVKVFRKLWRFLRCIAVLDLADPHRHQRGPGTPAKPQARGESRRSTDRRPISGRPSCGTGWRTQSGSTPATNCARLVQAALARLPGPYRMAVLLRDIEQLSGAEAATVLGIPIPTLKTRLLRGRLMMREALAAYFADVRVGAVVDL